MIRMIIHPRPFDHPDAVKLNDQVQLEYAERYGDEGDLTPLDPTMFDPPRGLYLLAYDEQDRPVATGGWRSQDANAEGYADGDAEIKRMFVIPEGRGRGLAPVSYTHGPGDRRPAAGGGRPVHLLRLRGLHEVRVLPRIRQQHLHGQAAGPAFLLNGAFQEGPFNGITHGDHGITRIADDAVVG